jgi:oligopeptidase B
MSKLPPPPVAEKRPHVISQLGRQRTDDYAWLKDENWQKLLRDPSLVRPDIRAHLEAENAYTQAVLAGTEGLQETIVAEIRGRMKEDDSTLPSPDGPYDYYARYETGGQHPIYARRPRGEAEGAGETVLLNVDDLAKGCAYYDVGAVQHTDDHRLLVYAVDNQGSEVFELFVKDLTTGETTSTGVTASTGAFALHPDSQTLFWVWRDDNGRPSKVFRRPILGHKGEGELVYDEADEGMFLAIGVSSSRRLIVLSASNHDTSEVRIIDIADSQETLRLVAPRTPGVRYSVDHWPSAAQPGRLVIHTDADGAIDFKLCLADLAQPGRAHWTDLVPHRPGRFLVGVDAFARHLVRLERVNANNRIVIMRADDLSETVIAFDEPAYVAGFESGYEFDTTMIRLTYQSPTTPKSWYDYDMATGARTLVKTQTVPSGHDPKRYEARRLFATASDGAEVPITLPMTAGAALDGTAPLLLYGYGSYGISIDPGFSISRLSLVDRGVVFAIAHVRGGSEKGWGWFLSGRGAKKTNTFTDFIACAEALIAGGYTRAGRIVAMGGSAGGMLMGAAANLRPDLFAGIIGQVPFVDVLNTMSDASLPLTPPEWPEWGNPLESEADYDRIAAYSPYDNITAKAYPAVLATGGLSDPRVTYWEPAKWAAKLRAHTTSDRPILLKINMDAGHAGAAGRFDGLKEVALDYAFALFALGLA